MNQSVAQLRKLNLKRGLLQQRRVQALRIEKEFGSKETYICFSDGTRLNPDQLNSLRLFVIEQFKRFAIFVKEKNRGAHQSLDFKPDNFAHTNEGWTIVDPGENKPDGLFGDSLRKSLEAWTVCHGMSTIEDDVYKITRS